MRQQRMMESRNQRRPLPPERHIAAAKVSDHGYAGARGNLIIVAYLHSVRRITRWLMPDRLPMAADGDDICCL